MKLRTIIPLTLLVILLAVVAFGAFMFNRWTRGPLPQTDGTITVAGLNDEVTVIRDEWGVPHIYATNTADLRFAQGYVQAQDRWWQMEFWRHVGQGRIQEITGRNDSAMSQDLFIRTIGWQRSAERDLANLSPNTLAELEAFSAGINTYLDNRSAGQLAFEYNILGINGIDIEIEEWTPLDTLLFGKILGWNLVSAGRSDELLRSEMLGEMDAQMVEDYLGEFNYDSFPTIVQAQELPGSGGFGPQAVVDSAGITGLDQEIAGSIDPAADFLFGSGEGIGSNNWVVSGDLSETGMPLLANDPHLTHQNPSIWYEIGLYCQPVSDECPYHVRGFLSPLVPFVIIGHTEQIAWGVTNAGWDVLDLYRLEINPENDLQYRWNGEWRDMEVFEEEIVFGDGGSETIQVRVTHLGPVISDNTYDDETDTITGFDNAEALAIRWTGDDINTVIESGIQLNRARNWEDFYNALRLWDMPAQNFVYTDVEGNIGYVTPGRVPVRAPGHSGMLPVDGTTDEFVWRGYIPYEYLPALTNPERGYLSSANQPTVPLEYYDFLAAELGNEFGEDAVYNFRQSWPVGYRGARLNELLEAEDAHNFDTFRDIQGDNKSLFAQELLPFIAELDMGNDEINEARDWLAAWDYQMNIESGEAVLFAHFMRALLFNLFEDQLGDLTDPTGSARNMHATTALLADPDNVWWDDINTDAVEDRDTLLVRTFNEAYAAAVEALGADRADWQWGELHTTTFVNNPLGISGIGLLEDMVNVGPIPTGGGSAILNATRSNYENEDNPFAVRTIPSLRMLIDAADFGNNRSIHPSGQSGHPFSSNYDNFAEDWAAIIDNPMLSNREDVEANAAGTLILQPG